MRLLKEKMYQETENGIAMTYKQYDEYVELISDIPKYDGVTVWPETEEMREKIRNYSYSQAVLYFIWLVEYGDEPASESEKESKKYISEYLREHLFLNDSIVTTVQGGVA